MGDERITPDRPSSPPAPSIRRVVPGITVAGLAVVALAVIVGFADFGTSSPTETSPTSLVSVESTATTTVRRSGPLTAAFRDYTAEDLEDPALDFSEIPLPPGMEAVAALGRFDGRLTAIGGDRDPGGMFTTLFVASSADDTLERGDNVWREGVVVFERPGFVEHSIVGEDRIVVVVRHSPTADLLTGELVAYATFDGREVVANRLGGDTQPVEVTSLAAASNATLIFGRSVDSQRLQIQAALPSNIRALLAAALLETGFDEDEVVVTTVNGVEVARYPLSGLEGVSETPPVRTPISWQMDSEGGLASVAYPFGDGLVEHIRSTDHGHLVAQVRVPTTSRSELWESADGHEWEVAEAWIGNQGAASGGVADRAAYVRSLHPPGVTVVAGGLANQLQFETPVHRIASTSGSIAGERGAIIATEMVGNLNPPSSLTSGRSEYTVAVAPDGATSIWRLGEHVLSDDLQALADLGHIDVSEQRVYLAAEDGTDFGYLRFDELRFAIPDPVVVPGGVGVLVSRDLENWSFNELRAAGTVVASHVDDDLYLVATDVPRGVYGSRVRPTLWIGRRAELPATAD